MGEAFARGCCTMLATEQPAMGSHTTALWTSLWPLAVHPKAQVAEAAALALCRLTWLAKPASASGSSGSADASSVPDAELAISTACTEFGKVFQLLEPSLKGSEEAPAMAPLQCTRLLSLLRNLVLCGNSSVPQVGNARKAVVDQDALITLPVAKLISAIDLVFAASFRSSTSVSKIVGNVSVGAQKGSSIAGIFVGALELAASLVDTAGAAVLAHAARLRKWIELVMESPLAVHEKHCRPISALLLAAGRSTPSILLCAPLLKRLVRQLSILLQKAAEVTEPLESVAVGRKRKHGGEALAVAATAPSTDLVQAVCLMLTRLFDLAAPLVPPAQVGGLCEQLICILWLGVMAPTTKNARSDNFSGGSASHSSAFSAARCRELCHDTPTAMALMDLVAGLHQPSRFGVASMAANVVDAFAALLVSMAAAHQRRIPRRVVGRSVAGSCRDEHAHGSVRVRAMEVRNYLLSISGRSAPTGNSTGGSTSVSIFWPTPCAPKGPDDVVEHVEEPVHASSVHTGDASTMPVATAATSMPVLEHTQQLLEATSQQASTMASSPPRASVPDGSTGEQSQTHSIGHEQDADSLQASSTAANAPQRSVPESTAAEEPKLVAASAVSSTVNETTREPQAESLTQSGESKEDNAGASGVCDDAQGATLSPPAGQEDALLPGSSALELFPGDGDGDDVSIPELCMDSPDSDNPLDPLG